MYHLTHRMEQHLRKDLQAYHAIFQGGRCSGWELEELFVRAIKSDTTAQHHVHWKEAGHDSNADVLVRTNGTKYPIQIKSGQIKDEREMKCKVLVLSGYRLSRFKGDFTQMTNFLNNLPAPIIALPCEKTDDDKGRTYIYQIAYIKETVLTGAAPDAWVNTGAQWKQTLPNGVLLSLTENMSWQVWWRVPLEHVKFSDEIRIT